MWEFFSNLPSEAIISIVVLIIGVILSFFKKMVKLAIWLSVLTILIIVIVKLVTNV